MNRSVGAPPKIKNKEDAQKLIDEYFTNPPIRTIYTSNGELHVPDISITGLAIALGFESRQSIYDYEKKPEFSYTIKRARLFIENEYEGQLRHGNTTGAIFALKNLGWKDKTEQDITTNGDSLNTWTVQPVRAAKDE